MSGYNTRSSGRSPASSSESTAMSSSSGTHQTLVLQNFERDGFCVSRLQERRALLSFHSRVSAVSTTPLCAEYARWQLQTLFKRMRRHYSKTQVFVRDRRVKLPGIPLNMWRYALRSVLFFFLFFQFFLSFLLTFFG